MLAPGLGGLQDQLSHRCPVCSDLLAKRAACRSTPVLGAAHFQAPAHAWHSPCP